MGTVEEIVNLLRTALTPGADPSSTKQAADMLRTLLVAIEGVPGTSPSSPEMPDDFLGAFIEKLRPLLPPDRREVAPRLDIPLVPIPKR